MSIYREFCHEITDTGIHTVTQDIHKEIELVNNNRVIAINGYLNDGYKGSYENFINAVENEVLDTLNEYLSGFP